MALEATGDDVDGVAQLDELARQLEDEDHLPSCVRLTELGLGGHMPVEGQHEDARPLADVHSSTPTSCTRQGPGCDVAR